MRICVLGNARAVHTQRWCRAYAERGHEVHLLTIRNADIPGVHIHTIKIGPLNTSARSWTFLSYVRLLLSCRRWLEAVAPDVVHAHYTITHGVIAGFAGYHPIALSAWGSDVVWDGQGEMPILQHWLNTYAMRKADEIFSTSRFMAEQCSRYAPGRRIVHIPFGIDPDHFAPRSNRDSNRFQVGFVKTLEEKYGPRILLEAMASVLTEVPDAHLIIAGRGSQRDALEAQATRLGIAHATEFRGFVDHDEVPELIARCDALVNCSVRPSESFGVVILEASACEVPVVVSRVGGVTEACVENETAVLVDPGNPTDLANALIRLARDPALRDRLGRNGRRFVLENYLWSDNVTEMLAHLERLRGGEILRGRGRASQP
jgi:L-malate glycosyltransferase